MQCTGQQTERFQQRPDCNLQKVEQEDICCLDREIPIPKNGAIVVYERIKMFRVQEYYDLVKREDAYIAVEKNVAGSRPKELFEDVLEEADARFEADRSILKVN